MTTTRRRSGLMLGVVAMLAGMAVPRPSHADAVPPVEPVVEDQAAVEEAGPTLLFTAHELGPVSPMDRQLAGAVVKACTFEVMSREGPSPQEQARCNMAINHVSKVGARVNAAIVEAIDKQELWEAKTALYDVLARTGDMRLVGTLITGAGRAASANDPERLWELEMLNDTLVRLTFANPTLEVPGQGEPFESEQAEAFDLVMAWRKWQRDHFQPGTTRDQLRLAAFKEARANAPAAKAEVSYAALRFLLRFAPQEGVLRTKQRIAAGGLGSEIEEELTWQVDDAEFALEQKRLQGPSKKALPLTDKVTLIKSLD